MLSESAARGNDAKPPRTAPSRAGARALAYVGPPMRPRPPLVLAVLLASLVLAADAPAQHGMASGPRPLHLRLAETDVVAIATVEAVGDDRVALRDAIVLRGEAAPAFEVKLAPSKQIPWAVGLAFVLPLRGARSPYVLVDDAREIVALRDDAAIAAWREALPALLAAGDDPDALRAAYLAWLDGDDESLREVAGAALVDPRGKLVPLPVELAVARAEAAVDPARPQAARRVSAALATGNPEGTSALLARALARPDADPQVVEVALRAAVQWQLPERDDALL